MSQEASFVYLCIFNYSTRYFNDILVKQFGKKHKGPVRERSLIMTWGVGDLAARIR